MLMPGRSTETTISRFDKYAVINPAFDVNLQRIECRNALGPNSGLSCGDISRCTNQTWHAIRSPQLGSTSRWHRDCNDSDLTNRPFA